MTDEEVAVIEAACAIDRLLWPPQHAEGIPLSEVHMVVQALHDAVQRLEHVRQTPVADS